MIDCNELKPRASHCVPQSSANQGAHRIAAYTQQIGIMAPKMAWATQVDAEEADGAEALPALPAAFAEPTAFPSLGDAVKVQETKAEKKKRAQKMSLADLHSR